MASQLEWIGGSERTGSAAGIRQLVTRRSPPDGQSQTLSSDRAESRRVNTDQASSVPSNVLLAETVMEGSAQE
jgi:hypothetical protein